MGPKIVLHKKELAFSMYVRYTWNHRDLFTINWKSFQHVMRGYITILVQSNYFKGEQDDRRS